MHHKFGVKLFFLLLSSFLCQSVWGQLQYTQRFTNLLKRCDASFIMPIEGWYKIKLLRKSQARKYDLVLESEEHDFEIRFKLNPNYALTAPHVTCAATVSDLAINNDYFDIRLNVFSADQAWADFNAEWAAYADFVPKPSISDKYYGRLVMLYRDDHLLQTTMFFNKQDEEKDIRLYSLSFLPGKMSESN